MHEVGVELVAAEQKDGRQVIREKHDFIPVEQVGSVARYRIDVTADSPGLLMLAIRIYPKSELLPHRQDFAKLIVLFSVIKVKKVTRVTRGQRLSHLCNLCNFLFRLKSQKLLNPFCSLNRPSRSFVSATVKSIRWNHWLYKFPYSGNLADAGKF